MKFTSYILPVVVGSIAGMMLITMGEWAMQSFYPPPAGLDYANPAMLSAFIRNMPLSAFLWLLLIYATASFFAGLAATLVGRRSSNRPAIIVGAVLTLAGLINVIRLPHPLWFGIASALVYLPFAAMGFVVVARKKNDKTELFR